MNSLLIARRELRVNARGRIQYWLRLATALVGGLVAVLLAATLDMGQSLLPAGMLVLYQLTQIGVLACLAAGTLLAADAISSEKRSGTLGILFLTHLKGRQVVLGKMISAWTGGAYTLAGLLPVMALPVLMGGVTAWDFLRAWILLICTLVAALAVALFLSCGPRREQTAYGITALVFAGICFVLPILQPDLEVLSPAHMVDLALFNFDADPIRYYQACAGLLGTGSVLLILAGWWAPRCWQERTVHPPLSRHTLRPAEGILATDEEALADASVGDRNPLEWWARKTDRSSLPIWVTMAMGALAWMMTFFVLDLSAGGTESVILLGVGFHLILKAWIVWEAGRRFTEDKRSGMMEVLLSTPLTTDEIVRGNLGYLLQRFWPPALMMVGVDLALVVTLAGQGTMEQTTELLILELLGLVVLFVAECVALAWVGCWLSLQHRRSTRACIGAVLRVLVLPSVLFLLALWIATPRATAPGQTSTGWVLLIAWCGMGCANAMFWTAKARSGLLRRFREVAAAV